MIDNLLTIAFGILGTLMAYGKIPMSKDPAKNQEYLDKYGNILKIFSIVLIVLGLILMLPNLFA